MTDCFVAESETGAVAGEPLESAPRLASRAPDELLFRRAVEVDRERGAPGDLGATWQALLEGNLVIVDHYYAPERWYLVLAADSDRSPVAPRARLLLTRLLLGESQKVAGFESSRSRTFVSTTARQTLAALGVDVVPSKVPALVAVLARAGSGGDVPRGRFCALRHGERELRIVSIPRPQFSPDTRLSPAEREVTYLLAQGKSYAEIARARGKSTRTIANQIGAVFRRLGISGRAELIARLAAGGSAGVRQPQRVHA